MWAHHLASGVNPGTPIQIPALWSNAFIVFLLSHNIFECAKAFAKSNAISLQQTRDGTIEFSIPKRCPSSNLCCIMADNEIQSSSVQLAPIEMDNSTNPKEKKIKRKMEKKGSPLVENEVRRSPRLKEICKGFKQNVCFNKKVSCMCP